MLGTQTTSERHYITTEQHYPQLGRTHSACCFMLLLFVATTVCGGHYCVGRMRKREGQERKRGGAGEEKGRGRRGKGEGIAPSVC